MSVILNKLQYDIDTEEMYEEEEYDEETWESYTYDVSNPDYWVVLNWQKLSELDEEFLWN